MRPRAAIAMLLFPAACGTDATKADDATPSITMGLVDAPGYELVLQNCISCHSADQFLQQRGDRETWLGLIRWMQKDHNLRQLEPATEDAIVEYLATHYGPERKGRRVPIPAELMPPNPYAK